MEFKTNSGIWGTMFGVPCIVADNFLKLASDGQIKVLLYILRCSGRAVSAEEISVNTGVAPEQAADAVMFWQQANVLTSDMAVLKSTVKIQPEKQLQASVAEGETNVRTDAAPPKKTLISPSEISSIICENADIAELFKIAETILGPLNPSMQNSLIWMFNYLGLKKEVILILIGYCAEINKSNASYIEKIASSWAEKEINTLETATAEVERLNSAHTFEGEIKRLFELRQNPTANQKKFISQWQDSGYSAELIHYAYEKTVEQINKVSFEYINKILISWNESGYRSPEEVKSAENEYRKKKKSDISAASDGFNADKYKVFINNI